MGLLPLQPGGAPDAHPRLAVAVTGGRLASAIAARLRGRRVRVGFVRTPAALATCLDAARPHVLLMSESFVPGLDRMVTAVSRRFDRIPILIVAGNGSVLVEQAWRAQGWGALGVVAEADLLRGSTLLDVVREVSSPPASERRAPANLRMG